jgi:hypothetical protein
MRIRVKNVVFNEEELVLVSSTDSPDSSYGLECWVDEETGESYGQCQFGVPMFYELIEVIDSVTP